MTEADVLIGFKQSLLIGWAANGDYAQRLVADLEGDQWVKQPGPGMNHPAWILAHLSLYHGVLATLLRGGTPEDPKGHRFGMQSKPEADASVYGDPAELVARFVTGHVEVTAALEAADAAALQRAMPIERWATRFAKVSDLLGYVMLVHEATHLGQLSAWRRVQGLASV